jgi:hypothetical protein
LATVSVGFASKAAVTACADHIGTVHGPVPEQPAPLQPANEEPLAGEAFSVTSGTPSPDDRNEAEQLVPQSMPAGELVTVPEPLPAFVTVSVGYASNVAVTPCGEFIRTVQVPVPEQPLPLQPANKEPLAGWAVSVTSEPYRNEAEQLALQLMPAGELVIEPEPTPAFVTVSVWLALKVAVTLRATLIVTVQVPVPEQPSPLQPANVEPAAGVAVRVTTVSWSYWCWQLAVQFSAPPSDTDPVPAPASVTDSGWLTMGVTEAGSELVQKEKPVPSPVVAGLFKPGTVTCTTSPGAISNPTPTIRVPPAPPAQDPPPSVSVVSSMMVQAMLDWLHV